MNYADLKKYDVANGPGVRVSLFVSGCTHHCRDCFNREAWDFDYGEPFTEKTVEEILAALSPDYIKGLSLLGGEPFEPQNQAGLLSLLRRVHEKYPEKSVWCYTGYDYEKDLLSGRVGNYNTVSEMLSYIDILVDGEFVAELKNLALRFKGSSNQRIIDVKESLKADEVVLWPGDIENNKL